MTAERPVEPVDASTVILVRHGFPVGEPWQCFMVRRHVQSEFAADVFVFPGGKVDPEDRNPEIANYIRSHDRPNGDGEDVRITWLALKVTAVRELFEEAGVLLANGSDGTPIRFAGPFAGKYAAYRRQVHAGRLSMLDLARAEQLCFAGDRLHPFSRWITPETLPRRFDTRFFVAFMPAGQEPLHDATETTDSVWIAPAEALRRFRQGDFPLVFATEKHLERMTKFHSIEELIDATSGADLRPVVPRTEVRGAERIYLLPGEEAQ